MVIFPPYGGSAFSGMRANANAIIAFEASFEFGGVAVFVSGLVTRLRFSFPCILYLGALFRNLQTISG